MQLCQPYGLPTASCAGRSTFDSRTTVSQRVALVQQFPLFSGIPAADCTSIVSAAHERYFSRRQTIFYEGDPIRQILLLTSGCVKETQFSQSGSEVILRLNRPGELVGPLGYSREGHRSTARALQPSKALVWDAASFEAESERFPTLRRNLAHILGQRLEELEERFRGSALLRRLLRE